MTEKEKIRSGILYDANNDKELVSERLYAKDICFQYNNTSPNNITSRQSLISKLCKTTGKNYEMVQPFYCDYGYNIEIGENFFSNTNVYLMDCARITFGDNVFIGPNSGFYTAGHPIDKVKRNQGFEYARPISVGNDVWIGAGVNILPGVTIGDDVIIGAGSVVNKDIPSGVIAAGNPCKVIRKITQEDRNGEK